jgi:dynein heavy chain
LHLAWNPTQDDLDNCHNVADVVAQVETQLQEAHDTVALINGRERLFSMTATPFPLLYSSQKAFQPYAALWSTAAAFTLGTATWMAADFNTLSRDEVEERMQRWHQASSKLAKSLTLSAPAALVAQQLAAAVAEFRKHLPLIMALRNPGLRARHWRKVREKITTD